MAQIFSIFTAIFLLGCTQSLVDRQQTTQRSGSALPATLGQYPSDASCQINKTSPMVDRTSAPQVTLVIADEYPSLALESAITSCGGTVTNFDSLTKQYTIQMPIGFETLEYVYRFCDALWQSPSSGPINHCGPATEPQPFGGGSTQPMTPYDHFFSHEELQALAGFNAERSKKGAGPLTLDENLTKLAREHSQKMANRLGLKHSSLGYSEIILYGAQSPQGAVNIWVGSAPHHQIMTDSQYTRTGIGPHASGYWTAVFE